ncbi:glycoprotein precursor [Melon yellow spot virus]|uniref:Envelopment polyprotein n=1 Tax=Melon yellow spot virus TaxID=89471 RepID=Q5KU06_9VIRU|nr:glycoprotein precursor [Melon yellow spot virus]BAD83605.1 glycoprotein precursor [Melon yellow spot virus]
MKKYYLLVYCLVLLLLFLISEVYLLKQIKNTEKERVIKRFKDRYNVDDPEDLMDNELPIPEQYPIKDAKKTKLSRVLRNGSTTTNAPDNVMEICTIFDKKSCMIKGVSNFNAYYQIDDGNTITSCITESSSIFETCLHGKEIKKVVFKTYPVAPVMKLQSKKLLEIGTKFFFVDDHSNPINIDPASKMVSANVARLSVRLSGDCKINQALMVAPYQVSLKATENIGVVVKNIKDLNPSSVREVIGEPTINFRPDELDGNHFLLCGDKSSLISKVNVPVRNCVSKFSDEPKKIFFCTNFQYFRWIFILLIISFPINWLIWRTRNSLSIWYDIMGIVIYPILWLLNWLWKYFPFQCRICGCFSLAIHNCSNECVCNQGKSSRDHLQDCYIIGDQKGKWKDLKVIQQFQLIINTKISVNAMVMVTKLIIASILISFLPSSLAASKTSLCVDKCRYNTDLSALTIDRGPMTGNGLETCECSIGLTITETIYRDGVVVSKRTKENDCMYGSYACQYAENHIQNLFACRNGCNALKSLKDIPTTNFNRLYSGSEFKSNLTKLKLANRLRNGFVDSFKEAQALESESLREYMFYNSLKIEDIPPENLMPRQSLVFSTEIDGKYRYMIEMDIKSNTGSIFLLNDDSTHLPMEFLIYVKSVGVEYSVRYKYSTSKIETTIADYLVTCTGSCNDCFNQKPKVGKLDFCVTPTSWWGCEELGCLAINEGSICGHCTNIYDLSTLVNIYQVVESHVTAEVCIKSVDGYNCKKHTDRTPIQTDHYQLDMTVDLHNDYMSVDKLFAVDKQMKVYTGNIADLGEFSSSSFGHPQITIDGNPLSVLSSLSANDFTWSCSAIGEKKINIKQCGLMTYSLFYTLESSKGKTTLNVDENKLYMSKDFLAGKLKVIVDMPKEMFKKIPKKPILSDSKISCSGCIQCAMGIDCNISYTSDTTFSARLVADSCSFKSDQIGTFLGSNKNRIKMYCSKPIEEQFVRLVPEDQSDLTVRIPIDDFVPVDQDTIIHIDDKSAHDENKHHSDTSLATFWDWVKAPFNWVASFFGAFFDIVRIILVVIVVGFSIYMLNSIYKLSLSYYKEHRKKRIQTKDDDEMMEALSKNSMHVSTARKRRTPPRNYEFSLDI